MNLSIYFWLWRVFVAAWAFSLVAERGSRSSLWCVVFSLQWLLFLWSEAPRLYRVQQLQGIGSVAVAPRLSSIGSRVGVHGFRCSLACGILPDQKSNLTLYLFVPRCTVAGEFFTTAPPGKPWKPFNGLRVPWPELCHMLSPVPCMHTQVCLRPKRVTHPLQHLQSPWGSWAEAGI